MAKTAPSDATVVALLKKNPGESMQFYADKLGIPLGAVGALVWKNEPVADASLKFSGTDAAIVKARNDGMRWERIAARTGKTVGEVKKAYENKSGQKASESYTGRGRPVGGASSGTKRGGRKTQATSGPSTGTSGRRGKTTSAAKTGSTAKRGAAKKTTAKKASAKRGTRSSATGATDPK